MKNFHRFFVMIIIVIGLVFLGANLLLASWSGSGGGRPYRVEISRIAIEIEKDGLNKVDLSKYEYVTQVERYSEKNAAVFYDSESDYAVREVSGSLYRFDYVVSETDSRIIFAVNSILGIMAAVVLAVMAYIDRKILLPFEQLKEVPYELSKGNLTIPVKEEKNRFFGRFVWGVDLLRENIEQQKQQELKLQKEKKTLLLSISHDIKTPLSAIKLYSQALKKGLYTDRDKQLEIAENISAKTDEIEGFIAQIVQASNRDFLELEVHNGEFYLAWLVDQISLYYREKLALVQIDFSIGSYCDCILKGDGERSIEVLQNVIENAVKYGDGHSIEIRFSEEEGCQLITVKNSGCTLPDIELCHIFESFWRGSNSEHKKGNGLGLYICRQLMNQMNGDIWAEIRDGCMCVTSVFGKA